MNKVYVVTKQFFNCNLVVGVYDYKLYESVLRQRFPYPEYVITEYYVRTEIPDHEVYDE
jgi:hypothetical protein